MEIVREWIQNNGFGNPSRLSHVVINSFIGLVFMFGSLGLVLGVSPIIRAKIQADMEPQHNTIIQKTQSSETGGRILLEEIVTQEGVCLKRRTTYTLGVYDRYSEKDKTTDYKKCS